MNELNEGITSVTSIAQRSGYQLNQVGQSGNSETLLNNSREKKIFPDNVSLTPGDISLASLRTRHDQLNTIAKDIRAANKVLDQVAKIIGEKHEEVLQYEKQYPPFQDQSSEKVEFLNSIAALKRQIDALTLIPDNKELGSTVSDPLTKQSSEEGGSIQFSLSRQEFNSGEDGLNIASINSNASDTEIRKFGQDLALAGQKLDSKKADLAEEKKTISYEIGSNGKDLERKVFFSEQEATIKSEEIKDILSTLPNESVGNEYAQHRLELLK